MSICRKVAPVKLLSKFLDGKIPNAFGPPDMRQVNVSYQQAKGSFLDTLPQVLSSV